LELIKLTDFLFKAKEVSAGIEHSLILTEDDRLYACGNNMDGNLGLGHNYSSDSFL
jgi:alpha-tubulin suppressor-like RCC1 family protein